jgi:hypothetical protein
MHDEHRLSSASHSDGPDKSRVDDAAWTIDRASLAALLDMGLNVQQIAHYLSVPQTEVVRMLRTAGLNTTGK